MKSVEYERLIKWYGDRNIKTILYASVDLQEALRTNDRKGIISALSMIESIVTRYSNFYGVFNDVCDNADEINQIEYQQIADRYSPRRERMSEARFENE